MESLTHIKLVREDLKKNCKLNDIVQKGGEVPEKSQIVKLLAKTKAYTIITETTHHPPPT